MKDSFFNKRITGLLLFVFLGVLSSHVQAQSMGNIINGAKNDIEKANQSQTFWYDGYWWGVFKESSNNKWAVAKLDGGNWSLAVETGIYGQYKADVHVNETTGKLYIMVSKGTEAFTRLTYSSGSWSEDSGFPIALHMNDILGDDPASLAQAADGDLFVFYESNDSLKTLYSSDDGVTWTSYVIKTKMDVSTLTDGIGFSYGGLGQMALFVGQGSTNKKFYFFRLPDTASPSDSANWINETLPSVPTYSDDHVNIVRDSDNDLYMIGKNGKSGPVFYLYKRNNNASWEYYTFDGIGATRPALSINEDNDTLTVCATNDDKIEYVGLDKDNLVNVDTSYWSPIIQNGTDVFNNVTLSNQILSNLSDVLVCAENVTQDNLWFNRIYHPDISLPVFLSSFSATVCNSGICLTWTTQSEVESAYFILGRSEDGQAFKRIAKITSEGNSSAQKNYTFIDPDIDVSTSYFYRLSEQAIDGKVTILETTFVVSPPVPVTYRIKQNYPNPFNPSTAIGYQLSAASQVNLSVYNSLGQRVRTLVNKIQERGSYRVTFYGEGFSSGIYFYRLQAGQYIETRKMILSR